MTWIMSEDLRYNMVTIFDNTVLYNWNLLTTSLVAQMVKNLPVMQETWVWSLGWEDPLEKGLATHSSILAWRIPWKEKPGGLQSMVSQRIGYDWASNTFTFFPLKGSYQPKKKKKINYKRQMCEVDMLISFMQESFTNVYIQQIITMYISNSSQFYLSILPQ